MFTRSPRNAKGSASANFTFFVALTMSAARDPARCWTSITVDATHRFPTELSFPKQVAHTRPCSFGARSVAAAHHAPWTRADANDLSLFFALPPRVPAVAVLPDPSTVAATRPKPRSSALPMPTASFVAAVSRGTSLVIFVDAPGFERRARVAAFSQPPQTAHALSIGTAFAVRRAAPRFERFRMHARWAIRMPSVVGRVLAVQSQITGVATTLSVAHARAVPRARQHFRFGRVKHRAARECRFVCAPFLDHFKQRAQGTGRRGTIFATPTRITPSSSVVVFTSHIFCHNVHPGAP
jgi:hypothetical protein